MVASSVVRTSLDDATAPSVADAVIVPVSSWAVFDPSLPM